MFSCKKTAVLLSKDLDHELPGLQRMQLRTHLLLCSACKRLQGQMRLQQQAADQVPPAAAPLSPEARDRIRRRLQENPPHDL